jgi:hypothetical protein
MFRSAANQTITSLGIRKGTGATGNWTVSLTDASGKVLTSATIDLTSGNVGSLYYGSASYQLASGTTYYLVTQVDTSRPTQFFSDASAVTLNSSIADTAVAIYGFLLGNYMNGLPGQSFVGLDFTIVGFQGSPTPAVYTISDNKKNTSSTALIILNYGAPVQPADVNDPDDANFFNNLRREAFDANPALGHVVLLATLTVLTNMTGTMLTAQAASPISQTSLDSRYATYKANGASADDLWNSSSDINAKLVDPTGTQPKLYARFWRLDTMRNLLSRFVIEMGLK